MHEKIVDIQNAFWKAYTYFKKTKDVRQYNADTRKICDRYRSDPSMLQFCQNIMLSWAPVINGMKEWS